MTYLGRSPTQGVRNRYYKTASGGETSISGALTGGTLTFTDGNYVDVNLNGLTLVSGTDYNTSTANTIAGLSALTANDVVEIVVYDVFSVFSGNVNSDFSIGGNLTVTGTTAFTGAITSSAGATITTADNTAQLTLKSTDADANVGPLLVMMRDSSSPADNDILARIDFKGDNDAGEETFFGSINAIATDVSDGAEDAQIKHRLMIGGAVSNVFELNSSEIIFNEDSKDIDFRVESNGSANMLFVDAGNDRVGIGTSTVDRQLHIEGSSSTAYSSSDFDQPYNLIKIENTNTSSSMAAGVQFLVGSNGEAAISATRTGDGAAALCFGTRGSGNRAERMRLDSSGNLLVGKTSSNIGTAGSEVTPTYISATRASNAPLFLNRTTDTGALISLRQDNVSYGQINSFVTGGTNYLHISSSGGSNKSGLIFETSRIYPSLDFSASSGTVDLGTSSVNFKRAYFSATVFAAGVGGISDDNTYINFAGSDVMQFFTGGSERGRIDSSGNHNFNYTGFDAGLGNTTTGVSIRADNLVTLSSASGYLSINRNGDGTRIQFNNSGNTRGTITVTGTSTAYNTSSDRRLKSNIQDAASASAKIDAMKVRQFDWTEDGKHQDYGMIAQELQSIEPLAVSGSEDSDEMMGVDYSKLVPMLIKYVQELKTELDAAKTRIATLEAK